MKKYSLFMQLPNGEWVRTSGLAYEHGVAQQVWKEVLLDAYRIGWPKRELRPVEGRISGTDIEAPFEDPNMGLVCRAPLPPAKRGGETTNRVCLGRPDWSRKVRLVLALSQTSFDGD